MNRHNTQPKHNELHSLLGTRYTTDKSIREAHAKDASYHQGGLPDAVVFPDSNMEVSEIVKICANYKIPIIPYGTGTGVEGTVVSSDGTLCLSLSRMNRILSVNPSDRDATVQAGVTRSALNTHLAKMGTLPTATEQQRRIG